MENSETDTGSPAKQKHHVLREKNTDSNKNDAKKRKKTGNICSTRIGRKDVCVIVCILLSTGVFILYMKIIVPSFSEDCNRVNEELDESALCMECRFFPDKKAGEEIRRYPRAGYEGGLCCSANLTVLLDKLYEKVRENKMDLYKKSLDIFAESSDSGKSLDIDRDLWETNNLKPFGHVTGVKLDSNKTCNGNLDVVASWPLKMIEYRSVVNGHVDRLTWGLTVPTNGVYRLHTAVNYYFSRGANLNCMGYAVHQLSVYSAKDGSERKLTERNQTAAMNHIDGLHSFLTALTRLDAGDIAFVRVSHSSAMKMQDGWHTEGLILVQ